MRDYLAFLSARRLSTEDRDLLSSFLGVGKAPAEALFLSYPSTTAEDEGPLLTVSEGSEEGEEEGEEEEKESIVEASVRLQQKNPAEPDLFTTEKPIVPAGEKPLFTLPDTSNPKGVRVVHDIPYRTVGKREQAACDEEEARAKVGKADRYDDLIHNYTAKLGTQRPSLIHCFLFY
jgi:hypothetical protein